MKHQMKTCFHMDGVPSSDLELTAKLPIVVLHSCCGGCMCCSCMIISSRVRAAKLPVLALQSMPPLTHPRPS